MNAFFTNSNSDAERRGRMSRDSGLCVRECGAEVALVRALHAEFGRAGAFNRLSAIVSAACLGTPPVLTAFTEEEELDYDTFAEYINELRGLLFSKLVGRMERTGEGTAAAAELKALKKRHITSSPGSSDNDSNSATHVSEAEMRYREYLLGECREENAKLQQANGELHGKIESMRDRIGALKREKEDARAYARDVNKSLSETKSELERVKECWEHSKLRYESLRARYEEKEEVKERKRRQSTDSPERCQELLVVGQNANTSIRRGAICGKKDGSESTNGEKAEESRKETEACLNCRRLERMYGDAVELCRIANDHLRMESERVNRLLSELL